jgi:hypothetical protein
MGMPLAIGSVWAPWMELWTALQNGITVQNL